MPPMAERFLLPQEWSCEGRGIVDEYGIVVARCRRNIIAPEIPAFAGMVCWENDNTTTMRVDVRRRKTKTIALFGKIG